MTGAIPKADAYGGVLVNIKGEVLLRKPAGHGTNYVWTFAKGDPRKGEKPDQAALRIVRETTGYSARIITPLPMSVSAQESETSVKGQLTLPGVAASTTAFYLMGPIGRQRKFEKKTVATQWINFDTAADLIGQKQNEAGSACDLVVLYAARETFKKVSHHDLPATCKEDWKTLPMPWHRAKIALDIPYDVDAMMKIRKGFLPMDMDEKWFAWFEEPILHLHRSWTGFCIYEVNFVLDRRGWRAKFALINRNSKQYTCDDDDTERDKISNLIDVVLIHAN